jgi:hypothetical protein
LLRRTAAGTTAATAEALLMCVFWQDASERRCSSIVLKEDKKGRVVKRVWSKKAMCMDKYVYGCSRFTLWLEAEG